MAVETTISIEAQTIGVWRIHASKLIVKASRVLPERVRTAPCVWLLNALLRGVAVKTRVKGGGKWKTEYLGLTAAALTRE